MTTIFGDFACLLVGHLPLYPSTKLHLSSYSPLVPLCPCRMVRSLGTLDSSIYHHDPHRHGQSVLTSSSTVVLIQARRRLAVLGPSRTRHHRTNAIPFRDRRGRPDPRRRSRSHVTSPARSVGTAYRVRHHGLPRRTLHEPRGQVYETKVDPRASASHTDECLMTLDVNPLGRIRPTVQVARQLVVVIIITIILISHRCFLPSDIASINRRAIKNEEG